VSDPRRAELESLAAAINEAAKAGRWRTVDRLTDLALALSRTLLAEKEALTTEDRSAHIDRVTRADRLRRLGVARSRAKGNELALAISAHPSYGTMGQYAKKRLRVSKAAFSAYVTGARKCPREVANAVREDFPGLDWTWVGGISG